ncbi:hypothetical protein [Streptomyces sp. NPDC056069]|uniref:hypothetical protein n=1 Tax=Streptomyces sp. NPDC056069 TaxID=3345702 RepID=UPI0035DC5902
MLTATIAAVTFAAGYVLGRVRPWDRLDTWVWRRFTFIGGWTQSKTQVVLTIAAHVLVRPRASLRIWRRRHEPPQPSRSPAVKFTASPTTDAQEHL